MNPPADSSPQAPHPPRRRLRAAVLALFGVALAGLIGCVWLKGRVWYAMREANGNVSDRLLISWERELSALHPVPPESLDLHGAWPLIELYLLAGTLVFGLLTFATGTTLWGPALWRWALRHWRSLLRDRDLDAYYPPDSKHRDD